MTHADPAQETPSEKNVAELPQPHFSRKILKLLYTQNPFYLLSVCFVLHGTGLSLHGEYASHNPWLLIGLIGGYLLMMSLVGVAVVRFGNVWDDARSILLIVLLLFVVLSLSLDDPLVKDVVSGRMMLIGGFLFSAALSEGLIWGLRIRLPTLFRLPFHVMLGLLFLSPLFLVASHSGEILADASWRIFLFFPIAAGFFLTLLPAIWRGAEYVRGNGTPWAWPWFPWVLFGALGAGICVRGFAHSLSFDPVVNVGLREAMELQTAYGAYFLVPILFSVAVLLLEMGIVSKRETVRLTALGIPFVSILLALPKTAQSIPYAEFLNEFMQTLGSPVFLTVIGTCLFYGFAVFRRVRQADIALTCVLLFASIVDGGTVDWNSFVIPQSVPLWLSAVVPLWSGWLKFDSRRTFLGMACAIAAGHFGIWSDWSDIYRMGFSLHLLGFSTFVVGVLFDDEFARRLRLMSSILLVGACVVAVTLPFSQAHFQIAMWGMVLYVLVMVGMNFLGFYLYQRAFYFWCSMMSVAVSIGGVLLHFYQYLKRSMTIPGMGSFMTGFLLLLVAALVSAFKAGMLGSLKRRLVQKSQDKRESSV